jgi:palmitoyl transferase
MVNFAPNTKNGNCIVIVRNKFFLDFIVYFWAVNIFFCCMAEESATDKGWFSTFTDNVAQTWKEPEHYDLYIPAITWHARFAYDKEKQTNTTSVRGGWFWSVTLG